MAEGDLTGYSALVTGGSTGIGRAAAGALARDGAAVAVLGIGKPDVDRTVEELTARGARAIGLVADVRDSDAVSAAVDAAVDAFGGLDVLVNSAGIQAYGTVDATTEQLWDDVLDINLKGMFLTAHFAVPHLRARKRGSIVNVASVQGTANQTGVVAYTASKAGILGLTRAIAVDHAAEGIRANTVSPGSVDTPMLRAAADQFRSAGQTTDDVIAEWGTPHPIGRVARPEEVGEVIAFLAGPRSSFVTGADIRVDGGLLAQLAVTLPEADS